MIDPRQQYYSGASAVPLGDAVEQGRYRGRYLATGLNTPYAQDPETRVIRLRHPRVRGKAAVKAAKRLRQRRRVQP